MHFINKSLETFSQGRGGLAVYYRRHSSMLACGDLGAIVKYLFLEKVSSGFYPVCLTKTLFEGPGQDNLFAI